MSGHNICKSGLGITEDLLEKDDRIDISLKINKWPIHTCSEDAPDPRHQANTSQNHNDTLLTPASMAPVKKPKLQVLAGMQRDCNACTVLRTENGAATMEKSGGS